MSHINGFQFSNFDPLDRPIVYQGIEYYTSENLYQALKIPKERVDLRAKVAAMTPGASKRVLASGVYPRVPNWPEIKLDAMTFVLRKKFDKGTNWRHKLIATIDQEIVEWNVWHDNYWGTCLCENCTFAPKFNNLGLILMKLREEFKKENV